MTRRSALATLGAVSIAGCLETRRFDVLEGGSATDQTDTAGRGDDTSEDRGVGPPTTDERLPLPMEPAALRDNAVSGGPPKDGIPSIDDPEFVPADEVSEWLDPGDPVFGLAAGRETKAYPQSILVQHEICNDVVGGTPVSVTYCPLTGTAMGFERGETTFGVSGMLVHNNLIMYDRATETWWPQVLATSIPGPWNEDPSTRSLSEFRVVWTTWERWSETNPDTRVLSRNTGFARNYDSDPYGSYNPRGGYYAPDSSPTFSTLSTNDRLPPKAVVLGARTGEGAAAFGTEALKREGLLNGEIAGNPVIAVHDRDLDTGYVFRNPDGESFTYRDGRVVDGTGTTYAPRAVPTERILAFDAMWFAWSGFYPETTLYV